jgi:mRNA interferase RelE/StbE
VTYRIELSKSAHKALKDISLTDVRKIKNKIEKLKKESLPNGCEKLEGNDDLYRIRSGDYRVIYQIFRKRLIILVVKIGHRREVSR